MVAIIISRDMTDRTEVALLLSSSILKENSLQAKENASCLVHLSNSSFMEVLGMMASLDL